MAFLVYFLVFLFLLGDCIYVRGEDRTKRREKRGNLFRQRRCISDANEVTSLSEFLCVFPRWPEQIFWLAFKPWPVVYMAKSSTVGLVLFFFRPFSIFPAWSVSRIRDFKHYSNNLEKLWVAERKFRPDVVYV